jgi:hypothetical protein
MGWSGPAAAALAVALLVSAGDSLAGDDEPKPFPTDRTQILKSGGTYFVEGRVHVGKGIDIKVQKDTRIVGRGDKGGVIELEGQLALVGITDLPVVLTDVTIEVQPKFDELRVSVCEFAGTSAGIRSPKDAAVDGRVFVENTKFGGKSTVDLTMSSNEIDLQRVRVASRVHVKAVEAGGTSVNKVKVNLYNNCTAPGTPVNGKLGGGVLIENAAAVEARTNVFEGDKVTFLDCGAVDFDENSVRCKTLEFLQTQAGRFGKTTVTKCDFLCEKIVVSSPCPDGKTETLSVVHCWFGGDTKENSVRDKFVKDHSSDPKCGVAVDLQKLVDKEQRFAK